MSSKADILVSIFLKHGMRWLLHEPQIHFSPEISPVVSHITIAYTEALKKLEVSNYGKDTSPELKGVEFKYPSCHLQVAVNKRLRHSACLPSVKQFARLSGKLNSKYRVLAHNRCLKNRSVYPDETPGC